MKNPNLVMIFQISHLNWYVLCHLHCLLWSRSDNKNKKEVSTLAYGVNDLHNCFSWIIGTTPLHCTDISACLLCRTQRLEGFLKIFHVLWYFQNHIKPKKQLELNCTKKWTLFKNQLIDGEINWRILGISNS